MMKVFVAGLCAGFCAIAFMSAAADARVMQMGRQMERAEEMSARIDSNLQKKNGLCLRYVSIMFRKGTLIRWWGDHACGW